MSVPRRAAQRSARAANIQNLSDTVFDVLIIGGGITGAGTARDAAMRGLTVAVIDKNDFASGTSSRSSRLIHGGIRYLENGQIHMVRESSRERAILLEIAPHLVHRQRFTWPIYRAARIPGWKLEIALTFYDRLARYPKLWRHERLDKKSVMEFEPALNPGDLRGGAAYFDAATDDSRLTLANIVSARAHGAATANYMEAVRINPGKPNAIRVRDELDSIEFEILARTVVDATGPWAAQTGPVKSKGSHIVVPRTLVGNTEAVTLLSPIDGRVMFVLPSGDFTIIGTTETWTSESPDTVRPSRNEVDYLLRSARTFFPNTYLCEDHVVAAWSGLRPLVTGNSQSNPTAVSREHKITREKSGMIRVTGGKMTTYRSMAAEVTDHIQHSLGDRVGKSGTGSEVLPGGTRRTDLSDLIAREPALAAPIIENHPATMAEVRFAVTDEMAVTISDILIRRTRVAFETTDHGLAAAAPVADQIAPLLGWTAKQKSDQLRRYAADTDRMFSIGDPRG